MASQADSYIGDSGGEDRADDMSLDSPGVDRAMGGTIRSDVGTVASVSGLSSDPGTPSLTPASVAGGSETMSQGEDRDLAGRAAQCLCDELGGRLSARARDAPVRLGRVARRSRQPLDQRGLAAARRQAP